MLGLSPRTWLYIAIAFALGLLLFGLIWTKQRSGDDFYRADGAKQDATGQQFEPLPGPDLDAAARNDNGLPAPADDAARPERALETAPSPIRQPVPASESPAAPDTSPAEIATTTAPDSRPVPISNPPPNYPPAALRRGDSGEALLRVHVGADGVPYAIDLVRGSGSRLLDRAATDAVRKWRFRPAISNGQPVAGDVQVPIAFNPGP